MQKKKPKASKSRPVRRNRARGQFLLARQIVAYVRENQFPRKYHLVETSLAEHFRVSRTLVRAALKHLAREKVVEQRRNHGFFLLRAKDELDGKIIDIPSTVEEDLYRRLVSDRVSGRIPESITQVALVERYGIDRSALLRVLARMANEGIVLKNRGHGWTFLPTINTDVSLQSSYSLRRTLEPSGILLLTFQTDRVALDRLRATHRTILNRVDIVPVLTLFEMDTEFHETIASFTKNVFFIQIVQQHNRLRRLIEFRGYEDRSRVRTWLREHISIIDALKSGNRRRAAMLMTTHLDSAYRAAANQRKERTLKTGPK